MRVLLILILMCGSVYSQEKTDFFIPEELPINKYGCITNGVYREFIISKSSLKFFLLFDKATAAKAKMLCETLNGVDENGIRNFRLNSSINIYLDKDKYVPLVFRKYQVAAYKSLNESDFKFLKLSENDYPIVVAYDNNNKLCGWAKTDDQINKLVCFKSIFNKTIRGKLLTETNKKTVVVKNETIYLTNSNNDTISKSKTDKNGNFELASNMGYQDYNLVVPNNKYSNIILATQEGREIAKMTKTENGFQYKLLDLDISEMSFPKDEEDLAFKFNELHNQNLKNISITENVTFPSGKYKLTSDAKQVIDKVVKILVENPGFSCEVVSHTDSQGDDESNLKLSENRAQSVISYLINEGIDKSRLKGLGKGETELRNRCGNEVKCSDKEHEYNRRTEFKFIKN